VTRAPFTPAQVASLNAYQASETFHPFTCGNELCPGTDGDSAVLIAAESGWRCPACPYAQDWAMDMMADGSWRDYSQISISVDGKPVAGELGELPERPASMLQPVTFAGDGIDSVRRVRFRPVDEAEDEW
jgi:hypothetical protein